VGRPLDGASHALLHRLGRPLYRFGQQVAGERYLRHARGHPVDSLGRVFGDRHGDPLDTGKALVDALDLRVRLIRLNLDYQLEFVIIGHRGFRASESVSEVPAKQPSGEGRETT